MNKKINLPDIWGQGAIFAYSGLDGECSYSGSLCGTLMADCLGVQFRNLAHFTDRAYFIVKLKNVINVHYSAVISDMICATAVGANGTKYPLNILFVNQNTVVFKSKLPIDAELFFDYDVNVANKNGTVIYDGNGNSFAVSREVTGDDITVAVSYGDICEENSLKALKCNTEKIINEKIKFYTDMPAPSFKNQQEEKLYYKCVSVLRSTVYTPEGVIDYCSLTPDRFPHRAIWLWDTAFLVIGLKYLSYDVAKQAIHAILQMEDDDGFLPNIVTPNGKRACETQPPVLAWAALELYKYGKDKAFLSDIFNKLCAYIEWDMKNRDIDGNSLPEWKVNDDPFCRCGESGMDNTPRFDEAGEMDSIDFASFLANEMHCLAEIAEILGKNEEKELWNLRFNNIKEQINTVLWDNEDGFYYDRKLCDGKFHKVKSVASFLPLFAGICNKEQAEILLAHLNNPKEFATEFPVPTISVDDKTYCTRDMFRGPVWLNFNILISMGLDKYGYKNEAFKLRRKTADVIKQWYINDGVIYEFYDSMNELSPSRLSRKGPAIQPYLPELHYQVVRDFSWGASAVLEFLNKDFEYKE